MRLYPLFVAVTIFTAASTAEPIKNQNDDQLDNASIVKKVAGYVILALLSILVYERITLVRNKGKLPGPSFTIPFLGSLLEFVRKPYQFWAKQELWGKKAGASWNYICGKFVITLVKAKLARIPFTNNSAKEFLSVVHPNAEAVFGKDSFLFMTGPRHQALRGSFIKLFTKKAIAVYLSIQEEKVKEHLEKWKQNKGEVDLRRNLQDLNAATSQAAFVGPYIKNTEEFQELMRKMGKAFLSWPISLPGTVIWKTKRARIQVARCILLFSITNCGSDV